MPDFIRSYTPGKATVKGVPQDRPSYDCWAVYPDEFDALFGTRGVAERVDWARYLADRGDLLRTHPHRLTSNVRVGAPDERGRFRHRRAYLLLRDPDRVPRMREPRPRGRVLTW